MKKIIGYQIVTGAIEVLDDLVQAQINDGWQPLGGVSVQIDAGHARKPGEPAFLLGSQAMVKYEAA